jgi:hypothetical protein
LGEAEGDLHFFLGAKNAKIFYRIRHHDWQCAASLQRGSRSGSSKKFANILHYLSIPDSFVRRVDRTGTEPSALPVKETEENSQCDS